MTLVLDVVSIKRKVKGVVLPYAYLVQSRTRTSGGILGDLLSYTLIWASPRAITDTLDTWVCLHSLLDMASAYVMKGEKLSIFCNIQPHIHIVNLK